ncbi:hypothetical protein FRB99_001898, partial [Tulasnella sp. 403]
VRRYAFTSGKYDDDRWTAQLVAACFTGKALRWHARLSPEVRGSWSLLEQALLDHHAEEERIIPTPAAALLPHAMPSLFIEVLADTVDEVVHLKMKVEIPNEMRPLGSRSGPFVDSVV